VFWCPRNRVKTTSDPDTELVKVPRVLVERLTETLAYVA